MLDTKKVALILCLILITYTSYSREKPLYEVGKNSHYAFLDSLNYSIYNVDISTAFEQLNALERQAEKDKDYETMYFCQLLKLERKSKNIFGGGISEDFQSIVNKIKQRGYKRLLTLVYSRASYRLWVYGYYIEGLHMALMAYDIYKDYPLSEFPLRLVFQHELAAHYYAFSDYEKAKGYLLEIGSGDTIDIGTVLTVSFYNTLGLCYQKLKQYDSAFTVFYSIYNTAARNDDYAFMSIAAGNIGGTYFLKKEYDSTIVWMERERYIADTYIPGSLNINLANSAVSMANIYYMRGDTKKAEDQLGFVKEACINDGFASIRKIRIQKRYYLLKTKILNDKGDDRGAYLNLDSARIISDSINVWYSEKNLLEAEFKIEQAKYELKLLKIEQDKKGSIYIRNTIIGVITFLAIILLLLINRRRILIEQKRLLLEKEKETTTTELNNSRKQLQSFTKAIHEKNLLIEQVRSQISMEQNMDRNDTNSDVLKKLRQLTILTDEEWNEFKNLFEEVYDGFIYELRQIENLTASEVRFMTLKKLKFSNKEMANILGVSESGIRNYKYRLRKKYGNEIMEQLEKLL